MYICKLQNRDNASEELYRVSSKPTLTFRLIRFLVLKRFFKALSFNANRVQDTRDVAKWVIWEETYLTKSAIMRCPNSICVKEKNVEPYSCVFLSRSKPGLLSWKNILYIEWWFIWSTANNGSLFQELFEVCVSLTLKFNHKTSSKPYLEPDMLCMHT